MTSLKKNVQSGGSHSGCEAGKHILLEDWQARRCVTMLACSGDDGKRSGGRPHRS